MPPYAPPSTVAAAPALWQRDSPAFRGLSKIDVETERSFALLAKRELDDLGLQGAP
jgi:hypothetical protein